MDCLKTEWQKPGSVRTIMELEGNDHYQNLKENSVQFWKEVQEIYQGRAIDINIGGREAKVQLNLKFPADMSAHWEVFHCAGARGFIHPESEVCHRCHCPYKDLGVVFDLHTVREEDSLDSIAEHYGIDVPELHIINPVDDAAASEDALKWYHLGKPPKEANNNKKKPSPPKVKPTVFRRGATPQQIAERDLVFKNPALPILGQLNTKAKTLTIRVHKKWDMTQSIPESALLHVAHIDCPPCMEHASQRVTEFLLNIVQVCTSNVPRLPSPRTPSLKDFRVLGFLALLHSYCRLTPG